MNSKENKEMKSDNRRDFLKKSALAGVAVAFNPLSNFAEGVIPTKDLTVDLNNNNITSKNITILITSDIHSQLNTHDEFFWENNTSVYRKRGGLAVLKTMIESYRKKNPLTTIVYDGGDFFHGHAVASLTEGEALIPIFNNLNYDMMLPGNWEVVYKKKKMLYDLGHVNAAKICANMYHKTNDSDNGELVYPPYWIKYIGGVKLGFIGYTDHLIPKRQSPAYSEGLSFEHAEKNIAKYVKLLREVEGCAVILVVTHMGLAQQVGLANNPAAEGVDIIIGADTHERVRVPIQAKYTKVVECGAFGSFLGKLELEIENNKLVNIDYQLLDVDPVKYPADKEMQALVDKAYEPFKIDLQTVIGTSKTPLVRYFVMETPMDNLITDAIKWKFKPDIALSNGFRFCQPLAVDPKTGLATITKEFLWNMLPVNSEAKTGIVSGKQVWDWLEKELQNAFAKDPSKRFGGWFVRYNGIEVNYTIGNEFGKRVNSVKVAGEPIDLTKEYSIVACEREGDPDDTLCRIEHVKNPKKTPTLMHDVIIDYLKVHSPVSPKIEGRATATDEPPTLLTQLKGTTYEFR
ncbi:MAG: bifunctional metallophosphatase/5'-nucleotidase [Bacteroidota bacterium]|nr:bifunctional metallophosphatase/5'-nucleotidase [Bacteroidota bacterium]MDP3145833.1 bifunctional metallophosphatase/5'-nucleotidase [Bacteroidota bacterium]MDP3558467.1 bifunctional metallophosphatase/5'-nucleotidase [Bacteroidota bacterium]